MRLKGIEKYRIFHLLPPRPIAAYCPMCPCPQAVLLSFPTISKLFMYSMSYTVGIKTSLSFK